MNTQIYSLRLYVCFQEQTLGLKCLTNRLLLNYNPSYNAPTHYIFKF